MKTILTCLFGVLVYLNALAQPEVRDERHGMVVGVQHALVMSMEGSDKSTLEKQWKAFTSKYGKMEKVKKTQTWLLQSAHLVDYPDIDRVNIFAEVMERPGAPDFVVWVEIDSVFINSTDNETAWAAGTKFLHDFAFKVKLDQINEELENENKTLEKLNKELEKLETNHTKYVSTINKAHDDIRQAESDIVINQREQETTTARLDSYSDVANNPDVQKEVKKLEKTMAKLKKQNLSYYNSIGTNKDRITENELNLEKNEADQEAKRQEIAAHEQVVEAVRARLNAVKAGDYNEGN